MAASALALFQRLRGSAAGRWMFSRLVCRRAPYFATIAPTVDELEPGRCVVRFADRRRIHNHIGTVHAIALCNAAELAGGLATDAGMAPTQRWIPKGMTVRYLAKARGTLRATATVTLPAAGSPAQDAHAQVQVTDAQGVVVFEADIVMWVSEKRWAASGEQ